MTHRLRQRFCTDVMATNEGAEPSDDFDYYPAAAFEKLNEAYKLECAANDRAVNRLARIESALLWIKEHGSKHGMPDEVWAIVASVETRAEHD